MAFADDIRSIADARAERQREDIAQAVAAAGRLAAGVGKSSAFVEYFERFLKARLVPHLRAAARGEVELDRATVDMLVELADTFVLVPDVLDDLRGTGQRIDAAIAPPASRPADVNAGPDEAR